MNILVSGGTGFIGSHLVDALVAKHHNVRVPVRPNSDLTYLPVDKIEKIMTSLTDFNDVKALVDGADVIFHLAAIRTEWGVSDEERRKVNVETTQNLLEASVGQIQRFVYVSSVSVHGHFSNSPANEAFPIQPATQYGKSKAESEKLAMKFYSERDLPVTIIRPVITYGPRDLTGMLTKLISLIHSGKYRTIGSGKNRVHLMYISDLIQAFLLAFENPRAIGQAYVVAGKKPITINELVKKVSKYLGKKAPKLHVPLWAAKSIGALFEWAYGLMSSVIQRSIREPIITKSKIDIMTIDRSYDIRRVEAELGYQPKYDYDEGIRMTVDWMKKQHIL